MTVYITHLSLWLLIILVVEFKNNKRTGNKKMKSKESKEREGKRKEGEGRVGNKRGRGEENDKQTSLKTKSHQIMFIIIYYLSIYLTGKCFFL